MFSSLDLSLKKLRSITFYHLTLLTPISFLKLAHSLASVTLDILELFCFFEHFPVISLPASLPVVIWIQEYGTQRSQCRNKRGPIVRLGQNLNIESQNQRRATVPGRGGRSVFFNIREMIRMRKVWARTLLLTMKVQCWCLTQNH